MRHRSRPPRSWRLCRTRTTKPVYAKLSPALSDIAESARAVVAAGADGLTLVNTIRGLALDPITLRPKLARGSGGYSGPALKPIALACVAACAASRRRSHRGPRRRAGPGSTLWSSSQSAPALSHLAPSCLQIRQHQPEFGASSMAKPRLADTPIRSMPGLLPTVDTNNCPANSRKRFGLTLLPGLLDSCAHGRVEDQVQAPARSLDQRMEALKRANDIRVRRAQLKKDLKDGTVQIDGILLDPPEYVSTAKVFDMLMAVPKFGRVKAARLLNQCRISQSKTVGGLSERQRAELVSLFNRVARASLAACGHTLLSSSSPARLEPAREH